MKALRNNIIELPKGLSDTSIYKLLTLLDSAMINKYQQEFTVDDEFTAIRAAVDYFYTNPERKWIEDEDGNLTKTKEEDTEAAQIDKDFLTMMILSEKATKRFFEVLTAEFDEEKLFNIEGDVDDILTIDPKNPYDLVIKLDMIGGYITSDTIRLFTNMINHLLYYHNLSLLITKFIQFITLNVDDKTVFNVRNINAIYYEQY